MRISVGAALVALVLAAPAGAVTVVAAGDIADCGTAGDSQTAELVRRIGPAAVLTLGDLAYPDGGAQAFAECYAPTWGAFRDITYPAPGNHEYGTAAAAGYFGYFGARAPAPYYSFDLGAWHVVSLNSEVPAWRGSAQERWLRRDLARDRRTCELVFWHRPRFSGGTHGSEPSMQALWRAAYEGGVDLALAGHDHNYQRFARLNGAGRPDSRFGIVQIVAGTGGKSHYDVGEIAHRRAANGDTFGVVRLALRRGGFGLEFVPVAGGTFTDAVRSARCHGKPAARRRATG